MIVGFIGVMIIIRPGGKVFSPVALLPLAAALCFGLYQIITRKVHAENPRTSLFYSALVGSVAMTVVLAMAYLFVPFSVVTPTLWHCVLILALGAIGGMGHLVLIRALRKAPASVLAPFTIPSWCGSFCLAISLSAIFPMTGLWAAWSSSLAVGYTLHMASACICARSRGPLRNLGIDGPRSANMMLRLLAIEPLA